MRMTTRPRQPETTRPDAAGTARVARRPRDLIGRVRPGDLALLDHADLDRTTAQALVDAGAAAVVNAGPMLSGRFASLGPELLVASGVRVVEGAGPDLLRVPDGARAELRDGAIVVDGTEVARGRVLDAGAVRAEMESARDGLAAQVETYVRSSAELLRREQELVLHGRGLPRPATRIADRTVLVVAPGPGHEAELRRLRRFGRETAPVVVAVDGAAVTAHRARMRADVVVLTATEEPPPARVLRAARDVVVLAPRGAGRAPIERVERLGIRPHLLESSAAPADAALLLAGHLGARLVVAVGSHAGLEDLLDRRGDGTAGSTLVRLALGPRLVDAGAVPALYSGRVRPRHLLGVAATGLIALVAALGVTPVGQAWGIDPAAWAADLARLVSEVS